MDFLLVSGCIVGIIIFLFLTFRYKFRQVKPIEHYEEMRDYLTKRPEKKVIKEEEDVNEAGYDGRSIASLFGGIIGVCLFLYVGLSAIDAIHETNNSETYGAYNITGTPLSTITENQFSVMKVSLWLTAGGIIVARILMFIGGSGER